jgi:hypothetical protein
VELYLLKLPVLEAVTAAVTAAAYSYRWMDLVYQMVCLGMKNRGFLSIITSNKFE